MTANRKSRVVQTLVLLLGLGASAWLFWGKPPPQRGAPSPPPAPVVDVIALQPQAFTLTVRTQGTVQPRRKIDLIAQVGGKVEQVADSFAEGGFFGAGEVLVQLEQQDYVFATQRARAVVADARQNLAMEKGRVRQAKREWRDLGDPEANELFLREPQLASAQANLAAAIADLEQAELELKRTTVTSPFSGRVLEQLVDVGQYLTPGSPVARIYSTDAVEVRLPLTDRQLAQLSLSLHPDESDARSLNIPVRLTGRFAGRDWHWQGTITRTDASIDSRSRVMYAVAEIAEPFVADPGSGRPPLLIGQFVRAEIAGRELEQALVLPRRALRAQNRLWLLDAGDRVQVVTVDVLQSDDRQVVVQGEFAPDSRVVVSTLSTVTPGMLVVPQVQTMAQGD